jgi:hypothetical protein
MHSPIEYMHFWGADPVPDLDHVFFVSGLAPGTSIGHVSKLLDGANLGKARVAPKCRGTQVVSCFLSGPPAASIGLVRSQKDLKLNC